MNLPNYRFLIGRAGAFRRVFLNTGFDGDTVLRDLAKFCRAHASTAHADPHVAARLDGRREVWLRLQHHLKLDNENLWRLYGGAQPAPTKGLDDGQSA